MTKSLNLNDVFFIVVQELCKEKGFSLEDAIASGALSQDYIKSLEQSDGRLSINLNALWQLGCGIGVNVSDIVIRMEHYDNNRFSTSRSS